MMNIFLLFSLFSIGLSQQLISLSSFKGENQRNYLPFPAPYSIYISAVSDDSNTLDQIDIVDALGWRKSLWDLIVIGSSATVDISRYVIQKTSYLQTPLTTNQMRTLKGVMFISTPKQVQDDGFQVFDINIDKTVELTEWGPLNRTALFLNTHENTNPYNSAIISNWQQSEDFDSSVFIYPGIPSDSIEPNNTHIFSNPIRADKFVKKFDTVEMFSLTMVAFYMKTYKGGNFRIQPGYWTPDRTSTYSLSTTGFYMKPLSLNTSLVTINTYRYSSFTGGYTGANILGHLSLGANVTVGEYGGTYNDKFSTPPKDTLVSWSTPNIGSKLTIASTPRSTGQYYVQYWTNYVDQHKFEQLPYLDEKPLQHQEALH